MIKIKFNNQVLSVESGTRVIDILDNQQRHSAMVCQIGAQIKELNYILTDKNDNMELSLKGLDHIEAGKAYEATLRYVISMAFHNLYPDVQIRFGYHISRSVFCQVLTPDFNMYTSADSIKKEVARIIAQDYPITRIKVSLDEAREIYRQLNLNDKEAILRYRPEDTAHLYHCNGYYDYMHSYMLASTGCIKNYRISPYSPGLIIQYPRYELDAKIPTFVEEATYSKTLQRAYEWSKKANLQTIADVNAKIENGETVELIQMCEARHNAMLHELGDAIEEEKENIRLLCIAGPSSSGKTTFCTRLKIELLSRGITPVTISMDNYYLERETIAKLQNRPMDDLDLEDINCLDIELFNKDLFNLINGQEVTLPRFNFTSGKREVGKTIRTNSNSPIIIEGIHALNKKLTSSIPAHQKFKIYIAPQMQMNIDNHSPLNITDLRLIRRIVRDMQFRNCKPATTIDMWQSVRAGEFKWIYPNQEGANYVFNSALPYELCIIGSIALPALREIQPDHPYYLIANRLIKYLKYFTPITDTSLLPCNSLLREFVGDSCFEV